jgi:hypothetical protein
MITSRLAGPQKSRGETPEKWSVERRVWEILEKLEKL